MANAVATKTDVPAFLETAKALIGSETNKSVMDDLALKNVGTIEDAIALLNNLGVQGDNIENYGTGFKVVEKDSLIKTPLVILEWSFHKGDHGPFVSAAAVTADGRKVVINDGSTGILKQLTDITAERLASGRPFAQQGLNVPSGLRASDFKYVDEKTNEEKDARTYYLA